MAGGKRRHARNPTAGGPRRGAGAGRRRPVPELPSFVSPASVAAAFSSPASGGRGRVRGGAGRRGGDTTDGGACHAVPFSYNSERGAQALEVTIDTAPCADPAAASVPLYSYGPEFVGGLGSHEDMDAVEEGAAESVHVGLGFLGSVNDCAAPPARPSTRPPPPSRLHSPFLPLHLLADTPSVALNSPMMRRPSASLAEEPRPLLLRGLHIAVVMLLLLPLCILDCQPRVRRREPAPRHHHIVLQPPPPV